MQINIGTIIPLKGKRFYCHEINNTKSIMVAREWDVRNWSGLVCVNSPTMTFLSQESARFQEGDVFSIELERLYFREVGGSDFHTIYSYHRVKKENSLDGSQRVESSGRDTADQEVESSGEGSEDRTSAGG